jgi:ribosomal protein L6, bacterial type
MSRVANKPVAIPAGVTVELDHQRITIRGPKGTLEWVVHDKVEVLKEGSELKVKSRKGSASSGVLAGTTRALVNNMVVGASTGYERRLQLVGVGFRAQLQGKALNLTLGYSHPISFMPPDGITIETPSQTEVVVKGIDKQKVGQVAAKIRSYRPPEPYKGKGVRYLDEQIVRKEAKKK